MDLLEKAYDYVWQEKMARRDYEGSRDHLIQLQEELSLLEEELSNVRMIVDHHRSGYRPPRYFLPSEQRKVSIEEKQYWERRAGTLRGIKAKIRDRHKENEGVWQWRRQMLLDFVLRPLKDVAPLLPLNRRSKLFEDLARDDIVVHASVANSRVHVYFGDPNDNVHGHGVMNDEGKPIYLRLHGETHGVHNNLMLGIARAWVALKPPAPLVTKLFFDKSTALVVPKICVNTLFAE